MSAQSFALVGSFSAVSGSQDIPIAMPPWARGLLVTVRRTATSTGTVHPAIAGDDGGGGGVFQISGSLTTIDLATTADGRWILHQLPGSHSGSINGHAQTRFPRDVILRLVLGAGTASFDVRVDWIP